MAVEMRSPYDQEAEMNLSVEIWSYPDSEVFRYAWYVLDLDEIGDNGGIVRKDDGRPRNWDPAVVNNGLAMTKLGAKIAAGWAVRRFMAHGGIARLVERKVVG